VFTSPPVAIAISVFPGPILPGDDRDSERGGRRSVKVNEAGERWGGNAATVDIFNLGRRRCEDEGTCDRVLDD
jgi:hypothetical protein